MKSCCSFPGNGLRKTHGKSDLFWARGYFVDTVGRNKRAIKAYIQNQLQEDQIADQISIKEFVDPFTGSKNTKA